jgi:4a-hydroxytetrahydrobiopterin dehydratase
MDALTDAELAGLETELADWTIGEASLQRSFQHRDFIEAMGFVTRVAMIAEKAFHHPDIDIRWSTVTLTLQTHDTGGLTTKDADLARAIDAIS